MVRNPAQGTRQGEGWTEPAPKFCSRRGDQEIILKASAPLILPQIKGLRNLRGTQEANVLQMNMEKKYQRPCFGERLSNVYVNLQKAMEAFLQKNGFV